MYKYKPNDIIKLKDGNICKIIRIADWNEYGCDFHFFEKNYVIDFIETKKILLLVRLITFIEMVNIIM